ncbi:MAG: site-specific integrase, partial [Hyphomicrobiaceae bacterium]|nr:site-specific integrase [Hyphomicrobiaceae bacterium]
MNTAHTDLIAKADLLRAFDKWLVYLTTERQLAEKTREAYIRDLTYFLAFLS